MKCHPPRRAREYVDRGWWSTDTIDGLLRARVAEHGDRLAVADPPNTPELIGRSPQRWSWTQLDEQVDMLAALLVERGVRAGDVVAVQLPNCVQLVRTLLATIRIGAIAMPLPIAYRDHELVGMCDRTGAVALLTTARIGEHELAGQALRVCGQVSALRHVLAWGDELPEGVEPISRAGAGDPALLAEHLHGLPVDVNDCVTICWTSGTCTPATSSRSRANAGSSCGMSIEPRT